MTVRRAGQIAFSWTSKCAMRRRRVSLFDVKQLARRELIRRGLQA